MISGALLARFRELFKKKMADSQVKKSNCMASCFEKAKTSVTIGGRNKVIPCTALTYIEAATIRPAEEKQRQACTDSQCGFCGCVALSKPSNYSFALTSTFLRD